MDSKRILREDVEIEFDFFIIAQGRWKQKPIRKSIRDMTYTYMLPLAKFLLFYWLMLLSIITEGWKILLKRFYYCIDSSYQFYFIIFWAIIYWILKKGVEIV